MLQNETIAVSWLLYCQNKTSSKYIRLRFDISIEFKSGYRLDQGED